ncbi:MAG: c-type cytochrome [Thermodesulfovibrionales bacterium]
MKQKRIAALFGILFVCLISACAREAQRQQDMAKPADKTPNTIVKRTDQKSIKAGKVLFAQKCEYCHDPYSTMRLGGPGLKDILKNPLLPTSKKPATPENIASQMRHPLSNMPSFVYLDEDDVENIIAFLNTL